MLQTTRELQRRVLVISGEVMESAAVVRVLRQFTEVRHAMDSTDMQTALSSEHFDAAFCCSRDWNESLMDVLRTCPDMPVVVVSRVAGEKEWIEALDAGAFDLLTAPYVASAVRSVLEHAAATREARCLHGGSPC